MVQMGPRWLKGVLGAPGGPSYVQGNQIECKEAQTDPSGVNVKGIHVGSKELQGDYWVQIRPLNINTICIFKTFEKYLY